MSTFPYVLTLCILIHSSIWFDTKSLEQFIIVHIKWTKVRFVSVKVVFTIANSVDPDEMLQNAAFNLGLHCLEKYPFRGFLSTKG